MLVASKIDLLCEAYAVAVDILETFRPLEEEEKRQLVSAVVHTFVFEGTTDVPKLAKTGAIRPSTLYCLTKLPRVH